MRDMACGGPYFSKLLLNAIYYGASKFSPRLEVRKDPADVRTAGWKFRERVRQLLGSALDQSDISTIQALLIMTNSLFALGDERSAAWLYAGLAFRMIVDLGMHIDVLDFVGARKFTEEDLEIRRRVFWGAFVIDKIQSLYQGRPFTIKESDTLVPIKFLDTYEELENWIPFAYSTQSRIYPGSPAYSVSTFKTLCTLSVVMSDVLSTIYAERSFEQSPMALANMLEKLQARLESWRQSLPDHLNLDAANPGSTIPPPHVLSLHAMYHVLVILLHRPFVADGHLYSALRAVSVKSFLACAEAASSLVGLLRAYDTAFSVRRAPYLISYATYVAATIHVRIAAKRRHDATVFSNLETCLAVFNENESTNWAVKRANTVIRNLMDRMNVVINEGDDGPQIHVVARRATNAPHERDGSPTVPERPTVLQNENGEVSLSSGVEDDPAITPNADWLDIDGIIQSFLAGQGESSDQNGVLDPTVYSVNATRDPVTVNGDLAPLTTSQTRVRPVPERDGARLNGLPQAGEMNNFLMATLDDPLFGFNGSGLDSIDDYRWI
ncbi:hypothetical protein KJ359_002639 [Pestalotiopsis sp. 9143b]|nr:hypothetical protein KJ359_002639 [Pestalotiopsis sp. 9143b]